MNYKKQLNYGIRRIRLQFGYTQDAFAEKVGLTVETIRNIEHNKCMPSSSTIDNICGAFNIEPIDLLLPDNSNNEIELIEKINLKLKDSTEEELKRINDVIDVIRKKY